MRASKGLKLKDELKKLGLRVRARPAPRDAVEKPGKVGFDDLGNAVFEWASADLAAEGEAGERARRRALAHPGLSIVDDEPQANAPIRNNSKGLRLGYNPYESGLLPKKELRKKRDLHELSKWIEAKKKLEKPKEE